MNDGSARDEIRKSRIALAVLALLLPAGCLERREGLGQSAESTECTACHGDATRKGDPRLRAAPPNDLLGARDTHYPGVGAHAIHLYASTTHGGVPCNECHVVPERPDSKGHADHPKPAVIAFGALANKGDQSPNYDPITRTCSSTYCHRGAEAVWTEARSSAKACGSCHGLPPPAPHPASERCSECHGDVVDAARRFVRPELHVDGVVQYRPGPCVGCHGSGDQPAPPKDTLGNDSVSAMGVGAHQAHLLGGAESRPLECTECHVVPEHVEDATHIDGLPAEVHLTGVAATDGRAPEWNHASATCGSTWCHGPGQASSTSPPWTLPGPLGCTSCHESPPPAPHPQMSDCSLCHGAVVGEDDLTIIDRARHVDGVVDVTVPTNCTTCHGQGTDPAPVPGTPGAGAHRTHLDGTERSRKVACSDCHHVPETVLAPGHLDSDRPAEVLLSGARASFDNGTCRNTECHGGALPDGHASGGSNTTPAWNVLDGSEAACGTCHGLPPPAPHPYGNLNPRCSACHGDIADDNRTFTHPELHVDGVVTFTVP